MTISGRLKISGKMAKTFEVIPFFSDYAAEKPLA
jgi:hypothetical protein